MPFFYQFGQNLKKERINNVLAYQPYTVLLYFPVSGKIGGKIQIRGKRKDTTFSQFWYKYYEAFCQRINSHVCCFMHGHISCLEDAEAVSQGRVLGCMAQWCPPQGEIGPSHLPCLECKICSCPGEVGEDARHPSPRKRLYSPAMKKLGKSPEWARAWVPGAIETRNYSFLCRDCMKNTSSLSPTQFGLIRILTDTQQVFTIIY